MMGLLLLLCPSLGVILSNALFLSPSRAVLGAMRSGQIGSLNAFPYTLMTLASFQWTCYGFCIKNGYIVASNLPGCCLSLWYLLAVLPMVPPAQRWMMVQIVVSRAPLSLAVH